MERLTLKQALAISKASQFLVGLPYDRDYPGATAILCITVCPYRDDLKERFVEDYDLFGTTDLTEYIDEDVFDVIAIARNAPEQEVCLYMDLRSYMGNNRVKMVA